MYSQRNMEVQYETQKLNTFFNLDLKSCEEIWMFLRNTGSEFHLVETLRINELEM